MPAPSGRPPKGQRTSLLPGPTTYIPSLESETAASAYTARPNRETVTHALPYSINSSIYVYTIYKYYTFLALLPPLLRTCQYFIREYTKFCLTPRRVVRAKDYEFGKHYFFLFIAIVYLHTTRCRFQRDMRTRTDEQACDLCIFSGIFFIFQRLPAKTRPKRFSLSCGG